jgi:hypothetical protein
MHAFTIQGNSLFRTVKREEPNCGESVKVFSPGQGRRCEKSVRGGLRLCGGDFRGPGGVVDPSRPAVAAWKIRRPVLKDATGK